LAEMRIAVLISNRPSARFAGIADFRACVEA
jgi:hypothetical protein